MMAKGSSRLSAIDVTLMVVSAADLGLDGNAKGGLPFHAPVIWTYNDSIFYFAVLPDPS